MIAAGMLWLGVQMSERQSTSSISTKMSPSCPLSSPFCIELPAVAGEVAGAAEDAAWSERSQLGLGAVEVPAAEQVDVGRARVGVVLVDDSLAEGRTYRGYVGRQRRQRHRVRCFRSSDNDHGSLGRGQSQGSSRGYDVIFSRAGQGTAAGSARRTFGPTPGPPKDRVWGYEDRVGFGVRYGCAG